MVSDSNSIFSLHESEDILEKKDYFKNFSWFQFLRLQDMHDYV